MGVVRVHAQRDLPRLGAEHCDVVVGATRRVDGKGVVLDLGGEDPADSAVEEEQGHYGRDDESTNDPPSTAEPLRTLLRFVLLAGHDTGSRRRLFASSRHLRLPTIGEVPYLSGRPRGGPSRASRPLETKPYTRS